MYSSHPNQFQPLAGYEKRYLISPDGHVKSLCKRHRGKLLSQRIDKRSGYWSVKLHKDGKDSTQTIHRLLALTFIPKVPYKNVVNHINGNKLDNRIENLCWVSHAENMLHAYDTGLIKCSFCGKTVIDECTGNVYPTIKAAANVVGISPSTLRGMLVGFRTNYTCFKLAS